MVGRFLKMVHFIPCQKTSNIQRRYIMSLPICFVTQKAHSVILWLGYVTCSKSLFQRGDLSTWHSEDGHFGLRYSDLWAILAEYCENSSDWSLLQQCLSSIEWWTNRGGQLWSLRNLLCHVIMKRPWSWDQILPHRVTHTIAPRIARPN